MSVVEGEAVTHLRYRGETTAVRSRRAAPARARRASRAARCRRSAAGRCRRRSGTSQSSVIAPDLGVLDRLAVRRRARRPGAAPRAPRSAGWSLRRSAISVVQRLVVRVAAGGGVQVGDRPLLQLRDLLRRRGRSRDGSPVKWRRRMLRSRARVAEQRRRERRSSAIELPGGVDDDHRHVVEPVEHALDARRDVAVDPARARRRLAGDAEQVRALVVAQPQRAGERREHGRRRRARAALLEPGEVVDRQAGELRDLLAPQAGRAAAAGGRQPDLGRVSRSRQVRRQPARSSGPCPMMAHLRVALRVLWCRRRRRCHPGAMTTTLDHRSQQGPRLRDGAAAARRGPRRVGRRPRRGARPRRRRGAGRALRRSSTSPTTRASRRPPRPSRPAASTCSSTTRASPAAWCRCPRSRPRRSSACSRPTSSASCASRRPSCRCSSGPANPVIVNVSSGHGLARRSPPTRSAWSRRSSTSRTRPPRRR